LSRGSEIPRSSLSLMSVCLQLSSFVHSEQSPSPLYQTWIPFATENVTRTSVLQVGLYPKRNPFRRSILRMSSLLSCAASVRAREIFESMALKVLFVVWGVTPIFRETSACVRPCLRRLQKLSCLDVRYPARIIWYANLSVRKLIDTYNPCPTTQELSDEGSSTGGPLITTQRSRTRTRSRPRSILLQPYSPFP